MALAASALQLAGFLLAHGFWTISEETAQDRYVPQALCETVAGERRMITFDAATPEQSQADANSFMGSSAGQFARCAFSRDAQVPLGKGQSTAALVIELRDGGRELTILQAYRPAVADGGFALLGDELVLDSSGAPLLRSEEGSAIVALREGAADHPALSDKWPQWNSNREPVSPLVK